MLTDWGMLRTRKGNVVNTGEKPLRILWIATGVTKKFVIVQMSFELQVGFFFIRWAGVEGSGEFRSI
jgi:hypothetical protein